MRKLELEIISPEGVVYEGRVHFISAPGVEGCFGMMYGHIPFCTALKEGEISINLDEEAKESRKFEISGGFLQLFQNQVTVLVEAK